MPWSPASRRTILVVDDNHDAADTLAALLRQLEQNVEAAYEGTSALAVARRVRPDIVFLDLALPGLDGFRIAEELRRDRAFDRTLIVAATGVANDQDRSRAHTAGIDVYII